MSPLFLGSHPAIDFLNTAFTPDGQPVETIGDGRAFLNWLVAAGLLEEPGAARLQRRFGSKTLDATAAEARKVREWARSWLGRWRTRPNADYGDELAALNKLLARAAFHREVVATPAGLEVAERSEIDSAEALLSPIAKSIAALITQEEASLLKHCAGAGCTLWFLDRTKGHRRLFCSSSACGNRAKVAAFRERQRP
jgi:predicted RNA-binding Zn ribbon-like protein